jgi:uncharacterized protein YjeT (DUF2065 family)
MESIILLAISIGFLSYGIFAALYPSRVKNSMNESHKQGIRDFGASDEDAEKWVKKAVVQYDWHYRIVGIICAVAGALLFYATVRTMLKS